MKQLKDIMNVANIETNKSALLIIDMEKAFIEPKAALCIAGAKKTVPACEKAVKEARKNGIKVIWIKRIYAADGSDMEIPRKKMLVEKGINRVLAPNSVGINSIEEPEGLFREKNDTVIIKPRFSAFFGTELDKKLKDNGINTVFLAGTTTPNCIRTTCYDAISYNFRTVILEACCSSQTKEIQKSNIYDMKNIGAEIFYGTDFTKIFK